MPKESGNILIRGLRAFFLTRFLGKIFNVIKSSSYGALKFALSNVDLTSEVNLYQFKKLYPLTEDEIGIVSCRGIGDTLMVAGMAHEIADKHKGYKIVLLVKPGHEHIAALFPAISKIYILDGKINYMDGPLNYLKLPYQYLAPGQYFYGHFINYEVSEMIGYKNITILDCYKALFKLNKQATLQMPMQPPADEDRLAHDLFEEHNLSKGRTVLFATGANSIPLIAKEFWINLCKQITGSGYNIVLNSKEDEYLLGENALYIDIPLSRLVPFAKLCGNVVSIRSGLCDLLSLYSINTVVIYPDIEWMGGRLIDGCSIKAMWPAPYIQEFVVEKTLPESNDAATEKLITGIVSVLR